MIITSLLIILLAQSKNRVLTYCLCNIKANTLSNGLHDKILFLKPIGAMWPIRNPILPAVTPTETPLMSERIYGIHRQNIPHDFYEKYKYAEDFFRPNPSLLKLLWLNTSYFRDKFGCIFQQLLINTFLWQTEMEI